MILNAHNYITFENNPKLIKKIFTFNLEEISNNSLIKTSISASVIINPSSSSIKKYIYLPSIDETPTFNDLIAMYELKIDFIDSILESININRDKRGSVHWKSWSLSQLGSVDSIIMKTREQQRNLQKAKKYLEKGVNSLKLARGVIATTKNLMQFYQDTTKFIIKRFIDEVDRIIRDIQSTGIYFLDATSYHFDSMEEPSVDYYYSGAWWSDNDKPVDSEAKEESRIKIFIDNLFKYKKETYNEFIEKICFHLTDDKDTVPLMVIDEYKKLFENDKDGKYSVYGALSKADPINNFKTGRPDFGPNSYVGAMVIAIALPEFVELMRIINAMAGRGGLFEKLFISLGNKVKDIGAFIKFLDNNNISIDNLIDAGKESYQKEVEKINRFFDEETKKQRSEDDYGRLENPYWVGVTMGSIFGFLFDEIDIFLNTLRRYIDDKGVNFTILDSIDEKLQEFIQDINNIIEIIENIDRLLEFINLLLSLPNLGILNVTVKPGEGGINGIVNKIKNADGFFKGALTNYSEINDIKKYLINNRNIQSSQYYFADNKYTFKKINEDYNIYTKRYEILQYINNKCMSSEVKDIFTLLSSIQDEKTTREDYLEKLVENQELIASNPDLTEQEKMDLIFEISQEIEDINSDLLLIEEDLSQLNNQLSNMFDEFIDRINDSEIWPYNLGVKIYNKEDIISEDNSFITQATEIINYNNTLIININSGRDISNFDKMLEFVDNKAKEIYNKENREDKLKLLENKFSETEKEIQKIIDKKAKDKILQDRINQSEVYDLDRKMCFAGCVFVWGSSGIVNKDNFGDNFTSWNDIKRELDYQNEENQILLEANKNEDAFKKVDKIIKKIF